MRLSEAGVFGHLDLTKSLLGSRTEVFGPLDPTKPLLGSRTCKGVLGLGCKAPRGVPEDSGLVEPCVDDDGDGDEDDDRPPTGTKALLSPSPLPDPPCP